METGDKVESLQFEVCGLKFEMIFFCALRPESSALFILPPPSASAQRGPSLLS